MLRTMMGGGSAVIQLMKTDVVAVIVQVPETQLPRVRLGTPARVRIDGLDRVFESRVEIVNDRVEASSRSIEVRMPIANADLAIKPGLSATAEILPEPREALVLERRALLGSRRCAFRLRRGGRARGPPAGRGPRPRRGAGRGGPRSRRGRAGARRPRPRAASRKAARSGSRSRMWLAEVSIRRPVFACDADGRHRDARLDLARAARRRSLPERQFPVVTVTTVLAGRRAGDHRDRDHRGRRGDTSTPSPASRT